MFRTVPVSIIRSFSLYTQQWYMLYRLLTACSQSVCKTQRDKGQQYTQPNDRRRIKRFPPAIVNSVTCGNVPWQHQNPCDGVQIVPPCLQTQRTLVRGLWISRDILQSNVCGPSKTRSLRLWSYLLTPNTLETSSEGLRAQRFQCWYETSSENHITQK
jgi:hypothetical protein